VLLSLYRVGQLWIGTTGLVNRPSGMLRCGAVYLRLELNQEPASLVCFAAS
jgi:hypothetical protein